MFPWQRLCAHRFAWPTILVFVAACPGGAADSNADAASEKWHLDKFVTISPRGVPVPAFKYRLFPLSSERKEGNAVPIYLRFGPERNDAMRKLLIEMPEKWNALPFDKLPLADVEPYVKSWKYSLKQMDLGARRKTAEWNYTLDAGNPIELLLPDLRDMRTQGMLLLLKARLEIAQSQYPDAVHTMETGFSFANQVGQGPFLISALVGAAITDRFLNTTLDMTERPDSPNLYWALAALPRPLCEIRQAMETEQRLPEMQIPDLADLERPRSAAEWDATLVRIRREIERVAGITKEKAAKDLKPPAGAGAMDPPSSSPDLAAAKKYLIEVADPDSQIEQHIDKLADSQVLVLYLARYSRQILDDHYKASYLPFFEAKPVLDRLSLCSKDLPQTEPVRFVELVIPAIKKVLLTQNRLERKVAALRVIEAIRLYAADHGGNLPEQLEQITEVPVPLDPGTNHVFQYRREGKKAVLESRIPGEALATAGLRYKISVRR